MKTQNKLPYAIIVGIDCITGLQSARILARHGVPVIGLAKDPNNFCCKTNVSERILQVNTASEDLIVLLESLGTTLDQKAVLFPCTDMSVLTISRHRRSLADRYHIALPEPEVVEMLMDKVNFFTYAQQNNLPIPKTFFLKNRADAESAAQQLSFPSIMKPPIKTPTWERNTQAKVYKVNDQNEFLMLYDQCSDWADLLMVQDWIDGNDADLYSCNCYFNANSEPLVTFIARKLRQWPPETGTSCLGEECRNDVVLETSIRLFRGVNYHGLGYLEMKRDQRTGQHFIIEPNIGRPTGRSAITEAGGVELLFTKYCDLANLPLPANREQKYEGVKWIYLLNDIRSSFYYWRRGELTFREWRQSTRGSKYFAVLSWNDPAPFLYHIWGAFLRVIRTQINKLFKKRETGGAGFAPSTGKNP